MKTLFLKGMLVLTLLVGMTMTRAYGYHVFVGEECIAAVINGKTDALIEKFDFSLFEYTPFGDSKATYLFETTLGQVWVVFWDVGLYKFGVFAGNSDIEFITIEVEELPEGELLSFNVFQDIRLAEPRPHGRIVWDRGFEYVVEQVIRVFPVVLPDRMLAIKPEETRVFNS